eukprot:TRINITY_DN7027_c1_g2_i1.p2 TRINITY_DN7027_c1_g2~~TRINITY_DN7027_c1_g2_i1.p2  ORF type:complete len:206 (-),score=-17.81 TRINITY_DN7027_c1_g2_i1:132-698(-)
MVRTMVGKYMQSIYYVYKGRQKYVQSIYCVYNGRQTYLQFQYQLIVLKSAIITISKACTNNIMCRQWDMQKFLKGTVLSHHQRKRPAQILVSVHHCIALLPPHNFILVYYPRLRFPCGFRADFQNFQRSIFLDECGFGKPLDLNVRTRKNTGLHKQEKIKSIYYMNSLGLSSTRHKIENFIGLYFRQL